MTNPNFELDKQMFWDQIDNELNSFDTYLKDTDWLQDSGEGNNNSEQPSNEENKRPSSYESEIVKEKFDIGEDEIKKISDPKERIEKIKQYYNENPVHFNLANNIIRLKKTAQQRKVDFLIEELEDTVTAVEKSRSLLSEESTLANLERYTNLIDALISTVKYYIKAYREREEYDKNNKRKVEYASKLEKIADKLYKKGHVREGNVIKEAQNYYKKLEIHERKEGDVEKSESIVKKQFNEGDELKEETKKFKDPKEAIEYFNKEIPKIKKELKEINKKYPDDSSMYNNLGSKDDQTWNNPEH